MNDSVERGFLLDQEETVRFARKHLMGIHCFTNPPPVVNESNGLVVVHFVLYPNLRKNPECPEFPHDWVSVWIDPETKSVVESPETELSEEEALAVAREAMSFYNYDKGAAPRVERGSSFYRFTFFNFPTKLEDGVTDYVGVASTAWVNAETKSLIGILFEED